MKSHQLRVIPPQMEPLIQQSLLNLAIRGAVVIDGNVDLTDLMTSMADDINSAYDDWLRTYRNNQALPESDAASRERKERSHVNATAGKGKHS